MSGPPSDKLIPYNLSAYSTIDSRAQAISNLIQNFYTQYQVYPNVVLLDSVVNGVYLGYYGD